MIQKDARCNMTKVSFEIVFDRLKIDFEKPKLIFVFGKFFEKSLLAKSSHSTINFFLKKK